MPFATHAVGWTAEGQVPPTAREQQVLELTCNGLVSLEFLRGGVFFVRFGGGFGGVAGVQGRARGARRT